MRMKSKLLPIMILSALATGCAKNVDRINFTKWGNSYVPQGSSIDTTAQGGSNTLVTSQLPQTGNNIMPRSSVGGAYQRSAATSPSYRMVGGFHVGNR